MHVLVIKESLYKEKPWIAESIYKASEEAKSWCLKQMHFSGAIRYMLPWLFADIDKRDEVFGKRSLAVRNRAEPKDIGDAYLYLVGQSFLTGFLAPEEMFAPIVTWNE